MVRRQLNKTPAAVSMPDCIPTNLKFGGSRSEPGLREGKRPGFQELPPRLRRKAPLSDSALTRGRLQRIRLSDQLAKLPMSGSWDRNTSRRFRTRGCVSCPAASMPIPSPAAYREPVRLTGADLGRAAGWGSPTVERLQGSRGGVPGALRSPASGTARFKTRPSPGVAPGLPRRCSLTKPHEYGRAQAI